MKRRYRVLLLLTSLAVLTYLDRLCISVLGPTMQRDLGLSPTEWGYVGAAFTIAYGAFEIPAGALGDRFGQRLVILRIVSWWSIFTGLTGAVRSFWPLFVIRFLFGAGEAGAFPNISGAAGRWFPPTERARVQGFVWGASRLGAIVAPLLVHAIVSATGNWRAAFWIFGSLGIVWAIAWYALFRDNPADDPHITTEELAEIGQRPAGGHDGVPWIKLFSQPRLWLVMVMYSFYVWGSTFYLYWLHTYLVKGRGFSETEMRAISSLPFILGAIANPIGGLLSDGLSRRFGLRYGRRLMGTTCLMTGAAFMLAAALSGAPWTAVILLALGFGALDLMLSSAWAVCVDLGGRYSGAVSGAMNSFGHIGGAICSIAFGHIVDAFGSYNAPLIVIAANVFTAGVLFAFIDPSRPLVAEEA